LITSAPSVAINYMLHSGVLFSCTSRIFT